MTQPWKLHEGASATLFVRSELLGD
jgi:hypothetical protein